MIERHDYKRWRVQFDSLADMVSWIERTPRNWRQNASRTNTAEDNWDLGVGYGGALRLARDGWPEGVRTILSHINDLPNKARPERVYDIAGDFADAPRAAAGDPFSMVRRGSAHRQRPVMTIGVNTIASGGTRADVLAKFGAALVAVIDRLENKGVRVELYGFAGYEKLRGKRSYAHIAWQVKGAGDSLDLSAVAFGIGHPAVMRRLSFAVLERSDADMDTRGYGICGQQTRDGYVDIAEGALLIEGVGTTHWHGQSKSMADMIKLAEQQINEASVKLCGEPIAELEELS